MEHMYSNPLPRDLDSSIFDDLKNEKVAPTILPELIEINPSLHIQFQAYPDRDRIVHFIIRTTQDTGKRHPYFEKHRASDLAQRSVKFFDQFGEIKGIAFDWGKPPTSEERDRSDNYTAYIDRRNQLVKEGLDYDKAKKIATKDTWTYKHIADPMKFSIVHSVDEQGENKKHPVTVTGIFYKAFQTPEE